MGMLANAVRRAVASVLPRPDVVRVIRGKFDAAGSGADNRRHWLEADGLSANMAMAPDVRKRLRDRARYEVANNPYAKGIVDTLANDVIGTGPMLKAYVDESADSTDAARVETKFAEWCDAVGLADTLRLMAKASIDSGECFIVLTTNERLDDPVKLSLRLIEADRVANPAARIVDELHSDGIDYDDAGNPLRYWILQAHPGGGSHLGASKASEFPAESVIHYFRRDRPEQCRGIPELTPSLTNFAQLRRYTNAVITAAETAANISAVLFTNAPASGDEQRSLDAGDEIEIERGMMMTLPDGYQASQLKAEQPTTTHESFVRMTVIQIGRALNVPSNVALGDSSRHNYSSGRLDHQTYGRSLEVRRRHIELTVIDRIFAAWFREAVLVTGHLPQWMRHVGVRISHSWIWQGREHVDPAKEATAQETRLRNSTTTLARECAKSGEDWRDVIDQRAAEQRYAAARGVHLAYGEAPAPSQTEDQPEEPAAVKD